MSANSSGKVTSKNNNETYSENYIQYDNEYKIDAYTTTSNGDEETITSSRSNSSYDGTNTNSLSSSDTVRTRNGQAVTVYKDGRKDETQTSSYERWWSESATHQGVSSSTSGSETWSSSYRRSDFKGGYSWSETRSGNEVETITKGGVSTSKRIYWTWSRSGTVWDDGRNGWNESWSKSSWINDKYTSESDSKNGSFDPQKTGQINDLSSVGDAPRLNKAPKDVVELNKQPKYKPQPSKELWTPPLPTPPRVIENAPDNQFAGSGSPGGKLPPKKRSALAEVIKQLLSFFRGLGEFVAGAVYQWLRNNGEPARWLLQVLSPGWNGIELDVERNLPKSWSFQSGRTFGDAASIVTGILEIIGGGGTGAGGAGLCVTGVGCIAGAPAIVAGTALGLHGATTASTGLQNIAKLLGVVFHSTTNGSQSGGPIRDEGEIHPGAVELERDAIRISNQLYAKDPKAKSLRTIAVGRFLDAQGKEKRVVSNALGYFTDKERDLLEALLKNEKHEYIILPNSRAEKLHAEERMIFWADAEKAKGNITGLQAIGVSHTDGICRYFCWPLMQDRQIRRGSQLSNWEPKPGTSRYGEPPSQ